MYWSLKKAIRDKALHALLHRRSTETPPVGNTAGSSSTGGDGTGSIRHGGRKKLSMRRNLTLLKHKLRGTTFSPTNAVGAGNQTQSGQSCDRTDIMRDTVVEGTLKNASEIMAIQHHNTVQRHLRPSRELSCVCKLRKEFDIAIFDAVESFMVQHKVRPVVMTARSTPLSAVSVAKPSSSQVRTETMDEYWDRLKCRLPDFAAARARARVGPKGDGNSTQSLLPMTSAKLYMLLQACLQDNNRSKSRFQQLPPYCCVVPLFLDVPDVFELRRQFKELDPRYRQVGVDDCANAFVRSLPPWGQSILSTLHDAAAILEAETTSAVSGSGSAGAVPRRKDGGAIGGGGGVRSSGTSSAWPHSIHPSVNFELQRRRQARSVLHKCGGEARRVREFCRRGCLHGQRRRLWQIMLQSDSPVSYTHLTLPTIYSV